MKTDRKDQKVQKNINRLLLLLLFFLLLLRCQLVRIFKVDIQGGKNLVSAGAELSNKSEASFFSSFVFECSVLFPPLSFQSALG